MATTPAKIAAILEQAETRFRQKGDDIITGYQTERYVDKDGDQGITIIIRLMEDGDYLEIFAPRCYSYPDGPNKLAVLQACMMISWKTKLVQFEYDHHDGEIRAVVEFPLMDAELTAKQLMRCLRGLVHLIDEYDPVLRKAMETGQIEFPDDDDDALLMAEFQEFLRQRAQAQKPKNGSGNPGGLQLDE